MIFDEVTLSWEMTILENSHLSSLSFFESPVGFLSGHPNQKPKAKEPVGVAHINQALREESRAKKADKCF